jgi:hypothetical protein
MNDKKTKNSELKQPEIEANNIVFTINYSKQPEEVIRISPEGFFWKGKLVQDDKEIYLRFKEWMDQAYLKILKPEPQKLNTIEELQNLVGLMQEALKFYADVRNYEGPMQTIAPIDSDEHGSQARFALDLAKKLADNNQKMQDEYDKLVMETESMDFSDGETNPMELLRVFVETHKDDKNI